MPALIAVVRQMRDDDRVRWLVALAIMWAGAAHAQPAPTEASRLFEEGRTFVKQGHYAEACDRFGRSFALDPAPGTDLNLGDCHEHLGHLAEAWRRFDDAATKFERAHDDREKFARDRLDSLAARLGRVVLKLGDPNVRVTIAGHDEPGSHKVRVYVDPGDVEIHAGNVTRHATVEAGATVTVEIAAPATAPAPGEGGDVPGPGRRSRRRVWTAYALAGAGVLAGGAGIGLGLAGRSDYNEQISNGHCTRTGATVSCDQTGYRAQQSAITTANVGTALGIVSAIAIGAGAIVYFTAPREHVVISPAASPSGAALTVTGSF